jgi:hypothetical protein
MEKGLKGTGNNFYESGCNLTRYQQHIFLGGLKKTTTISEDSQCSGTSPVQAWRFLRQHKLLSKKLPSPKDGVPLSKLQAVAHKLQVCERLHLGV